jgi:hypothetical protein
MLICQKECNHEHKAVKHDPVTSISKDGNYQENNHEPLAFFSFSSFVGFVFATENRWAGIFLPRRALITADRVVPSFSANT